MNIKKYSLLILMTGYIIEEPDNEPLYYSSDGKEEYWRAYSIHQRKRFRGVLRQLIKIWYKVYITIDFMRLSISIDESNIIMSKIFKIFFAEYIFDIDYYSIENKKVRSKNGYLKKKIKKLSQKIYKL